MKKQKNDNVKPEEELMKEAQLLSGDDVREAERSDVSTDDNTDQISKEQLLNDIEIKEKQFKELADKYMRLAAEYDNFRRRSQKEKESIYAESVSSVASSFLAVIDNIERGLKSAGAVKGEEAIVIREGMEMVLKQALDVMDSFGIKEVEALGRTFDPETMEAVMHCEDDDAGENEVVEVLSKGYIRNGKVIRHAVVKVAN